MQKMRILLQQKETGLFLKDENTWTPDHLEAREFQSSSNAAELCSIHKITGVHLVLRFAEEHVQFTMPLLTNPPAPARARSIH